MRLLAMVTIALTIAAATSTAQARTSSTTWHQRTVTFLRHRISVNRQATWRYQRMAGHTRTRSVHAERRTTSIPFLAWIRHLWTQRKIAARRVLISTAAVHTSLWMCIHSREGAWDANTGNGYYGGLQMTSGWGGVARPDLLSPSAQMALAEREYRASGYSTAWLEGQWPNTSPPCLQFA